MIQLTLDLNYYIPLCSCEGCFRDSTHKVSLGREIFDTCEYHYHELMMIDDWDTERVDAQIMSTPLSKALEYREEMFQYNNRQ